MVQRIYSSIILVVNSLFASPFVLVAGPVSPSCKLADQCEAAACNLMTIFPQGKTFYQELNELARMWKYNETTKSEESIIEAAKREGQKQDRDAKGRSGDNLINNLALRDAVDTLRNTVFSANTSQSTSAFLIPIREFEVFFKLIEKRASTSSPTLGEYTKLKRLLLLTRLYVSLATEVKQNGTFEFGVVFRKLGTSLLRSGLPAREAEGTVQSLFLFLLENYEVYAKRSGVRELVFDGNGEVYDGTYARFKVDVETGRISEFYPQGDRFKQVFSGPYEIRLRGNRLPNTVLNNYVLN